MRNFDDAPEGSAEDDNFCPQLSRRSLLVGIGSATSLAFLSGVATAKSPGFAPSGEWFDPTLMPPPESPVDFEIRQVHANKIAPQLRRQTVAYDGPEFAGTIVVDPGNFFLYRVLGGGLALRYGVGVGRAGFAWSGEAVVGMKRRWPRWVPPREMVERDSKLRKWINGQPGGPSNPLGARALYLFAGGRDTLYRIHGTNDPKTIGRAMSSGCVRMLNQDIADLYLRAIVGTAVRVRPANKSG